MRLIIYVLLTSAVSVTFSDQQKHENREYYIGAVVEYAPIGTPWDSTPDELLEKNTGEYVKIISEAAKHSADIIVFPEYGLTTLGIPRDRDGARPFLQIIPGIGHNPCVVDGNHPVYTSTVIRNLSCAALVNSIYVLVNLGEIEPCPSSPSNECTKPNTKSTDEQCPPDHAFHYNTNVVFDREGTIIAKYHKYKLYFEGQFNAPSIPDIVTFDTDFGVTFGTFTCFDIIFYDPAVQLVANGVRNFVFPSAWVDELPFLTAPQAHSIWALGANANLLASGYHQPLGGQLGSGIYSGFLGPLNYTFDPDSGTKLVLAKVPIVPGAAVKSNFKVNIIQENKQVQQHHLFLQENLSNYSTVKLDLQGQLEQSVCHDQFCCTLNYSTTIRNDTPSSNSSRNYRLIAFDGFRPVAQETAEFGWQVCGVIRCLNETLKSCTQKETELESALENFNWFHLSSSSYSLDRVMKPSLNTLDIHFSVIPFDWFEFTNGADSEGGHANNVQASSSSLANISLQTVAIINRIYSNKK